MRALIPSLAALVVALASPAAFAAPPGQPDTTAMRDGSHDFDPMLGVWKTQIRRIADPFSHPAAMVEMTGTVTTRKVWGGRAQLEEIEVDAPPAIGRA